MNILSLVLPFALFLQTNANNSARTSITANVNSQFNVQTFGAKGDCSTDDTQAFEDAQAAAVGFYRGNQLPGVILIPKAPGGCYIVSNWTWKGVSLEGQPSGIDFGGQQHNVVLKSKPGEDILHVPDPTTTPGDIRLFSAWSIRNISFLVDDSSTKSFLHRWPGRWFDDAAITAGSAVFKSYHADITCGDIGEPIRVVGAGRNGADLITTIANVTPCWRSPVLKSPWNVVTLATQASTTVTNAHAYISVLNLPVDQNIGNCAIAADLQDGDPSHWKGKLNTGMFPVMQNVSFITTKGASPTSPNGYPCAIFAQGNPWLYGVDAHNIYLNGFYFGIVQAGTELNSFNQSDSGDYEKWDHGVWFFNVVPWLSYNGLSQRITDIQITGYAGPHILQLANKASDNPSGWFVENMGFETPYNATKFGWRVTGGGHTFRNISLTSYAPGQVAYWDAQGSTCDCGLINTKVNGFGNTFHSYEQPQNSTDNGMNNSADYLYNGNPYDQLPPNYDVSIFPFKGYSRLIGRWTGDAGRDGNASTPYSNDDLIIWPRDLVFFNQSWATYVQQDPASPSGAYMIMAPGSQFNQFNQIVQQGGTSGSFVLGTNFPLTGVTVNLIAKCPDGTTSFMARISAQGGSETSHTFACSANYQTYTFSHAWLPTDVKKTIYIGSNKAGNTFHAASWQLVPWKKDFNITASGELKFTSIAAQSCQEQNLTAQNANATNNGVSVAPRASLGSINLSWSGWVSAPGAVSVRVCNPSSAAITPNTVTWGATVSQ